MRRCIRSSAVRSAGQTSRGSRSWSRSSRQVLDLPEMPRLWCVQHWIQTRLCPCCGKLRSSQFPAEASAPVCYGPRIKALGIYLVSYQHLPCERAAELLSDWLGAPVSVGSLQAWVAAGAAGLEGFLEEIRARLECAEVAHFDETGGRIDGRLQYIHAASTDQLTLYSSHHKRGVEAMRTRACCPAFAEPRSTTGTRRIAPLPRRCTRCATPTTCASWSVPRSKASYGRSR